MMTLPNLKTRDAPGWAAELVGRLAPEIRGCYVLADNQLPEAFRCEMGVQGYTCPWLAMALREHIEPWHGPAAAMVLGTDNLAGLAELRAKRAGEPAGVILARWVGGLALHEAAHILADTPPPHFDATPRGGRPAPSPAAHFRQRFSPKAEPTTRLAERLEHDGRFLRTTLHLAARARAAGFEIEDWEATAGVLPFHDAAEYVALLADEPDRMAGRPFADILTTEPPKGFRDRFERDLNEWWTFNRGTAPQEL